MENKKINVGWGLTKKCNMHCQFCYSKAARNEVEESGIEDWKKFVDRNHLYIDAINYGTGENTILGEFFSLVEYVRKNYPAIGQALTTNGYLSERVQENPHLLEIFKNCIDEVDVSIDFNNREKHGSFRGQPRAYDWATRTLELSKDLGKLSTIVFVGCNETVKKENLN